MASLLSSLCASPPLSLSLSPTSCPPPLDLDPSRPPPSSAAVPASPVFRRRQPLPPSRPPSPAPPPLPPAAVSGSTAVPPSTVPAVGRGLNHGCPRRSLNSAEPQLVALRVVTDQPRPFFPSNGETLPEGAMAADEPPR
ncbi:hypothetical protein BRADI_2g36674v3 [Brachypodium distachyon]|uniref:Uncharacterized protein n=1 Tax=Brachypodium distachyon TaxID=15368 RepID=A0A0Q3GAT8_BRADI|nr:hypothetical protein BRADI_2g36674v3 [Brachypodium distachyon]